MPNEPVPARQKRAQPQHRQNDQGDHEGSPHKPSEFKVSTPDPAENATQQDDPDEDQNSLPV